MATPQPRTPSSTRGPADPASSRGRVSGRTRRTASDEVADRVRLRILRGEFKPGDDLPAERDLSEQLGVSRLTLRSAIARLQAEGLVVSVHGSGTRVLDYREAGGIELIGHLLRLAFASGDVPLGLLADLLELRRAMAVEVLGLVADRASASEIVMLRAHVEQQALLAGDPARFVEADLDFARKLVRASHNLALELVTATVVRQLRALPGAEALFLVDPAATVAVYRRLLDDIERRDARAVRKLARRLLDRQDQRVLEGIVAMADALGALSRAKGRPTTPVAPSPTDVAPASARDADAAEASLRGSAAREPVPRGGASRHDALDQERADGRTRPGPAGLAGHDEAPGPAGHDGDDGVAAESAKKKADGSAPRRGGREEEMAP
jgi:DNA-binding FadR family transcriptional regulator